MKKIIFLFCLSTMMPTGITFGASGLMEQIEIETAKREQRLKPLHDTYAKCKILISEGESESACDQLTQAFDSLDDSLRATGFASEVKQTLATLEAALAAAAAAQNQWPEARKRSLSCLKYDPNNMDGLAQLKKCDEVLRRGVVAGEEVNPALTKQFFDRLSEVRNGLEEAQAFRETGQLQKAEERYEDVLQADPFNQVATEGIKKLYEERVLVAEKSRDLSNLERKREVREAWNNIYPKKNSQLGGIEISGPLTASPSYALEKKMQKTVIPQVDFSEADLETLRRALISLSRTYDPEPAKSGVNFIVSADVVNAQPVTLRLKNATLAEVVRYISQIAGVKVRNTDIGVAFSPLVETSPDLIPRDFRVSPSFFRTTTDAGVATTAPKYGSADSLVDGSGGGRNEQQKLAELGVVFPIGAYAVYNRSTSTLKVLNNAEMLDLIGQLISASEEETLLIQVGVRLIEINQNDLDSITMNNNFGTAAVGLTQLIPSTLPAALTTNGVGVTPITPAGGVGVNGQLNQIQGTGLLANNNLTAFLSPGKLAGTNSSASYNLNTMTLGGFLNTMQFSSLISAISQKNSANVLANPSLVLKRGQQGKLSSIQEFKYVKEYSDPQSSVAQIVVNAGATVPGPETVLGSFPSQISDVVPIGVELGVKPDVVGNDRVLLELQPTFQDFEGNINYGANIYSVYASRPNSPIPTNPVRQLLLTNVINQPVFVKREVKLAPIEVSDGYTLLLGGLLREDIQNVDEKIPLLGDIPIFGRMFQGKTEQAVKKNTLIFVTPRILDVSGQPLNPTAGSPTTASASGSP
jgi:general secretion pathway protein D